MLHTRDPAKPLWPFEETQMFDACTLFPNYVKHGARTLSKTQTGAGGGGKRGGSPPAPCWDPDQCRCSLGTHPCSGWAGSSPAQV